MNEFRADLHCHTTCSDGTLSPEELIRLAASLNLQGLSITDHDTIEAYSYAIPFFEETGIKWISGAEFSAMLEGVSIHILAYSFQLNHPAIRAFCQKHSERRVERNRAILEMLAKHGMPIDEKEVLETAPLLPAHMHRSITRPHIALAMVRKRYVATIQEAFNKYLREGGPCYASGNAFSIEETVETIHQAMGLAFIAHPHLINDSQKVHKLLQMNVDGIECYYAKFHPQENERWLKMAKKKNLLISGGSDFHGDIKPNIQLGCSWVNEETFLLLHNHFIKAQA
jgi:predicted metal-dependent phosphoesterase TrpH